MNTRLIASATCLAFLTACASVGTPDDDGVNTTFTNDDAKAFVAGLNPVKVSLQRKGEDRKLAAQCDLSSSKYEASFATPATVNVPAYSEGAVPATLSCTYEGQTYTQVFDPINLSKRSRNDSAAAVGILLCPICGIGMALGNSGNDARKGDIFGFKEMKIEF